MQMMDLMLWKRSSFRTTSSWSWSERRSVSLHCLVTPISSRFLIMQSFLLRWSSNCNQLLHLSCLDRRNFVIVRWSRMCTFCWQPTQETSWSHEAYLLFPVHLDGTLLDNAKTMKAKKEHYSTSDVLQIFRQVKRTAFSSCILLIIAFFIREGD